MQCLRRQKLHGSLPFAFRHNFHIYLSRISAHKWI
jgi:hypothetical protein